MIQYHTLDLLNNNYAVIADYVKEGMDFKIILKSPDRKYVKDVAKKLNDTEVLRLNSSTTDSDITTNIEVADIKKGIK